MTRRERIFARLVTALVAAFVALVLAAPLVPLDADRFARPSESIVVTDRAGRVLRVVREAGIDHRWVALEDVSPAYVAAVIAAEDARFHQHAGVDVRAVARALAAPLLPGRRKSGGSTLAQQTIKLTYGRRGGVLGKPLEMARALSLVRSRSRAFVLEEYVNRLPFGHGIVGIERASEVYFGKPARDLDLAEAALLAGIPQAPSRTEPVQHAVRALARRSYVLDRLAATEAFPRDVIEAARRAPLSVATSTVHPYLASRFAERALRAHPGAASQGSLRTSLDLRVQSTFEVLVEEAVTEGAPRGATNAAGVVLSVETGEVLAYVGAARAAVGDEGGAIDLVARRRHPGSTLKPFVYGAFFEDGASPATWLEDRPHAMTGADGSPYDAENFDGVARGRVHARDALAASLNLAALDVARHVGADELARLFAGLGLAAVVDGSTHGVGLALGGVSVSPYELARAYLALARGGDRIEPSFVPSIAGATRGSGTRVLAADAAALVTDVLRDPIARSNGFGGDLTQLAPSGEFALKTGTSPEGRDAWAAVYDARFVVVLWVGDPRGRPSRGLTGFANAAPYAVRALEAARSTEAPAPTERLVAHEAALGSVRVCALTGKLAGPSCPARLERTAGSLPAPCDGHHEETVLAARLRIVQPADGARLLVDASGDVPSVPVRVEGEGVRVFVDGRASEDARLRLEPGLHRVRAVDAKGHAVEARVEVEALVALAEPSRR